MVFHGKKEEEEAKKAAYTLTHRCTTSLSFALHCRGCCSSEGKKDPATFGPCEKGQVLKIRCQIYDREG